ncbi:gliding motility associated protien GldN [Filimonas lacunae]|uniref:Gliding motility associated protien GldN n=1 Tax=Filimonas lacunae TaxID=477680 RepID=A0A173MRX5_9BACT|nr:gliding motility protein GldN [Filimonas lacunae]BAV10266.1 gliding motility protein GldN [Filimonas lacunae]SIT17681.1 gliding motility associated protien GldN [Filimonas lacunae]
MKRSILKIAGCLTLMVALAAVSVDASAQKKRTKKKRDTTDQSGYGTTPSGYGTPTQQPATNNNDNGLGAYGTPAGQQPAAAPAGNVPIEVIPGAGGGLGDTIKPSLRNDNAIERNLVKERIPLVYDHIREDDAVYRQRVWRIIDAREKVNLPFRYSANEDNGNQRFISILYDAITGPDSVTAFNGDDDRFTIPLTKEQVTQALTGGAAMDTVDVTDLNGNVIKREVRSKQVPVDSIYQFKVKEEWIFDKESSRLIVRILGIAPMMHMYTSTGVDLGEDRILFWVYYPDLRASLATHEVFNGKNYGGRMSWEELFENRMFASRIVKSTLDNPFDRELKEYIKDPLFRLLEGENIKEKIFNYEQSLWAY